MSKTKENKMAVVPMKKLFWKMGLPMIISMVLQALYNVVDSVFVVNMGEKGALANQALTLAFPIQILIIAIGVGTGIGINAMLSKSLGENNHEMADKTAGNGIFLALVIYLIFLIFGFFGSNWFIRLFGATNSEVISMGTSYLKIVCCLSLGSIGYTVFERLLQATGRTHLSTISQISGALTNVVLDYIFIFPLGMGVTGAALATIIGQFVSLFIAMYFHYTKNTDIHNDIKYIKSDFNLIKKIYSIGISAAIMQALLSVMMAGMNAILAMSQVDQTVLIGSFGIYYKIQQIALFSAFGLSNTIISILSFNYGMKSKERIDDCIKYGIIDTIIITAIISVAFELFASPLASLFGLGGTSTAIISTCTTALRIASIGFIFMGVSVAIQGVLQSIGYAVRPLIISLLRLVVFVFPIAYYFTLSDNVIDTVWWTFPIAEVLTAIISIVIFKKSYDQKIAIIAHHETSSHLVVTISREHGTNGKEIGRMVAKALNISFYDKEGILKYAIDHQMIENVDNYKDTYSSFLSLDVNKDSIIKMTEVVRAIANSEDCIIVGRAADYLLRKDENLTSIFLYADLDYRINKVQEIYNDSKEDAKRYIEKSDNSRSTYYELVSNRVWGDKKNYDLCLDCKLGNDEITKIIVNYIQTKSL